MINFFGQLDLHYVTKKMLNHYNVKILIQPHLFLENSFPLFISMKQSIASQGSELCILN